MLLLFHSTNFAALKGNNCYYFLYLIEWARSFTIDCLSNEISHLIGYFTQWSSLPARRNDKTWKACVSRGDDFLVYQRVFIYQPVYKLVVFNCFMWFSQIKYFCSQFDGHHNDFSSFPPVLCSLKKLEKVDLSSNSLATVTADIRNMEQLQVLNLNDNQFEEFVSNKLVQF